MHRTGARFLAGPSIYDNSSGVVIASALELLPPAGLPLATRRDACDHVFGALAIAGLAEEWAAVAARGAEALPAFLLRLATALVTPASVFASQARIVGSPTARLVVFIRCEQRTTGVRAWDCACRAVRACLSGGDAVADFDAALALFRHAARRMSADITTAEVVREARGLEVPLYRLKVPGQFLQLGQGIHRRYLFDSTSDATGVISNTMSVDKALTNRILRAAGIPVLPMTEVVHTAAAVAAAERLGYPVVVKPCHGGQGHGVAVNLTSAAEVAAAFAVASADGDTVVVEKFASGDDYRVLVIGGRCVSVARRVPAEVTGDGRHSVAALVDRLNQDPRRGHDHEKLLVRVDIDPGVVALLARQGLIPASIPEAGRRVRLKLTANVSTGGTAEDATDAIHPDNRAILERAATAMELAIAGVDFLSDDITRSWRDVGGAVLELNAYPGLRPHALAHPGRSVVVPIIQALFQPGSDGRIPTCGITGSVGKTTTANIVARILRASGLVVGRCTTEGAWVGDERRQAGDCANGQNALELLLDRHVAAGVFELARGGLLNGGMVIEDCEVGAVLNVHDNHVAADGIADRTDLARVKAIVARRARRALVLNAEDPLCLAMRQGARAERIWLVGSEARSVALRAHIAAGGCAVALRPAAAGDTITLIDRGIAQAVTTTAEIPATIGGRHGGRVWNAMFAAAIAQAMGASLDHVRHGLRSFKPDIADAEGRFSVIDRLTFRVILDRVDGPQAAEAMAQVIRPMVVAGRKRLCVAASSQRSDELVRATGRALAGAFDRYICTNGTGRTGPDPQALPGLLRDGLLAAGVTASDIACLASEDSGLAQILREAMPGDLVVIATYDPGKVVALIDGLAPAAAGRERAAPSRAVL